MINYVEYLNIPAKVAVGIIVAFFIMQIIGEILELKGKVVPEFAKVRKYFARKKMERETFSEVRETLVNVQSALDEMNKHYSTDNIKMRNDWIKHVNSCLENYDKNLSDLSVKLDKNNEDTLELLIENMRSTIIGFASTVADSSASTTREQFNRVFKIYNRYENLINEHGMTNGEVDIAHRIIMEAYEHHMKNHTFLEDVRGYTK